MTDESPQSDDLRVPDGRVLVHIGPHKTGTTSLQAALFTARPSLREQGVHYAGWARNPARAVQAATGQASAYGDQPPPMREWHSLVRDVRHASAARAILSSEFLAHAQPDAVRRIIDDLGRDRVHVVTTLRPLARLIPSMWQQNIKAGRRIAFDAWLRRLFPAPGEEAAEGFWTLHRHDELINRWAAEVGIDRVTAVVVDESDREMILRTFQHLLGLREGTLQPVAGLANRSITAEEAEAIRAYNIAHRRAGLDKATHALAIRYGAAQYMAALDPIPGGTPIRLPGWAEGPVTAASRAIVDGIRASGVRVVGDLDALGVVGDVLPPDEPIMPAEIQTGVAARLAMGILVASGRTRAGGAVPEEELAEILPAVATRQLAATIAGRGSLSLVRRTRRLGRQAHATWARSRFGGTASAGSLEADTPAAGAPSALLPAPSIVLHIGPPKTGTTAIQAAFHVARASVERQGVHYAGSRRHSIAAIQGALGRRWIRGDAPPPIGAWHELRDEIHRSKAPRVLLSSEFFADADPERIRSVVNELGAERVQVVVTLRPLAKILPSQWQQFVQSGLRASYGPWLDAMLNQPGTKLSPSFWHRHRSDSLIARWASVVGPDRVTVVVVDDTDREMILRTFERLLGLAEGTLALQDDLANRSLTLQEIEAVRALNRAFAQAELPRTLHAEIVNFGATEFLKTLPQEPGTSRPELPGWAAPRVTEIAGEMVDAISSSGIRIIGELERLKVVTPGSGPGPDGEDVRVPPGVAARLGLGVVYASGIASQPEPDRRRAPANWGSGIAARLAGPIEIARVPTSRLVREMTARSRSAAARRWPPGGR